MLKIYLKTTAEAPKEASLLALGLFEGEKELRGVVRDADIAVGGTIGFLLGEGDFTGKQNQTATLYTNGKLWAKRLLLVGLGKKDEFSPDSVRLASGKAALAARELGVKAFATLLFGEDTGQAAEMLAQATVEGSELALYSYSKYYSDEERVPKQVEEMLILAENESNAPGASEGVRRGVAISGAVRLARELSNGPSNEVTPKAMAEAAQRLAEKYSLKCTVYDRDECLKMKMGGFLAVASGSLQPPKLIVLEYWGANSKKPPIVLVGKSITFDSGGISIKPADKMDEMKHDKSGGATVIAAMQAIAELKLPVNVVAIAPATENLPGGSAYKPGDILTLHNGKTVEVINTDAEGRLTLGDALAYGLKYKPEAIIDLATLTGACVIALGANISGLFTNNQSLADKVLEASRRAGEAVWHMPLTKEYYDQIKSLVADIKNSGGRPGGAITAAAFLGHFVGDTPWVHLDIAGTAWTQDGTAEKTYNPRGATGVGVRLILELLRNWS